MNKKSKVGGIAVVVLAGIYSLAAPQLNDRFGWNLPAIKTDQQGNIRVAKDDQGRSPRADSLAKSDSPSQSSVSKESSASKPSGGPLADRMKNTSSSKDDEGKFSPTRSNAGSTAKPVTKAQPDSSDEDLLYGILREISSKRYVSPEGLMYTPGSAEGHRLKHLERHTRDAPSRPGSHGVFDGEMPGALKTIDRAYERAKKNQRTTKKTDDGRTIYTVDMGGRVGFVGGRDGKRKRNPMARRVRLVLEGNRVITAYPL